MKSTEIFLSIEQLHLFSSFVQRKRDWITVHSIKHLFSIPTSVRKSLNFSLFPGIIYVVDSADRLALPSARSHLEKLLNHPNVMRRNIPLLFLANKTDVTSAMPPLQVSENMKVNKIKGKPCKTVGTDALTGEGLNEGLDWLAHQLRRTRQLRWSLSLEYEQHA